MKNKNLSTWGHFTVVEYMGELWWEGCADEEILLSSCGLSPPRQPPQHLPSKAPPPPRNPNPLPCPPPNPHNPKSSPVRSVGPSNRDRAHPRGSNKFLC